MCILLVHVSLLKRDKDFQVARIRAIGKFAFKIKDVSLFMKEIFGTRGIVMTFDIIEYLSSMVTEIFADTIGRAEVSVLELAADYRKLAADMQDKLNEQMKETGILFSNVIIESISLPETVEKLIDEQSGIGITKNDMDSFVQYQTARAMRDAVKQEGGLAGLGAGVAFGNTIVKNVQDMTGRNSETKSRADLLRELKSLLDDNILTQEEFEIEKKRILNADREATAFMSK